jgi:uncharacterized membrane protein (DUF485 family)
MAKTAATMAREEHRIQHSAPEVLESADFKALVRKRWTVSSVLLVALFVTYYGYILLLGWARDFMAQKVGEVTTLAIPVGAAVIVIAFVLTAVYVVWANRSYDPEVERMKRQLRE